MQVTYWMLLCCAISWNAAQDALAQNELRFCRETRESDGEAPAQVIHASQSLVHLKLREPVGDAAHASAAPQPARTVAEAPAKLAAPPSNVAPQAPTLSLRLNPSSNSEPRGTVIRLRRSPPQIDPSTPVRRGRVTMPPETTSLQGEQPPVVDHETPVPSLPDAPRRIGFPPALDESPLPLREAPGATRHSPPTLSNPEREVLRRVMASSSAARTSRAAPPDEQVLPPLPSSTQHLDWEQPTPALYPDISPFGPPRCCPRYPHLELWIGYCQSHGRVLHRFCRDCLERQAQVLELSEPKPAVEEPLVQPPPAVPPEPPLRRTPKNEIPAAPKDDYPRPPKNQIPKRQEMKRS